MSTSSIPSPKPRQRLALLGLAAALVTGLLAGCVGGGTPAPTALPLRPTATADFETDALQRGLEELVAAGAPGAVIEVRVGDRVWNSGAGVASLRSELPASTDHTFRIASLTKPMIGAIVLQLVDEGELELDDEFADYVPGPLDDAPEPVTVRQLLQHTSGMNDYIAQLGLEAPERIPETLTTEQEPLKLIELATEQGWRSDPGDEYYYSNANYIALTLLIEKIEGKPLRDSLRERITEPLGLQHTRLPEGTELAEDHLSGYFVEQGLSLEVTQQHASLWSGAGGVESTVGDVNTFMRALMGGVLVPPELLAEMTHLSADGYGLGLQARADSCPDRAPVMLPADYRPGVDADEAEAQTAVAHPYSGDRPSSGSSSSEHEPALAEATEGSEAEVELIEIGRAGTVYGHLGSGLGYRALTLASPDGARQVTIAWTASPTNYGEDPRLGLAYELADQALSVDC